jgi:hypothetical protein
MVRHFIIRFDALELGSTNFGKGMYITNVINGECGPEGGSSSNNRKMCLVILTDLVSFTFLGIT